MNQDIDSTTGQCHCGTVKYRVTLVDGLRKPVRCNCSMCRMKGAVMVFAALGSIAVTEGEDALSTYEFHTKVAKHHFCSNCGIHLFHQRRFDPGLYGVNVATLDGVSPFDFAEVPVFDGENHPKDTGGTQLAVIGHLRFEKVQAPS
jgi:hypothetical protein